MSWRVSGLIYARYRVVDYKNIEDFPVNQHRIFSLLEDSSEI
jgi:hypothetical protein